MKKNLLIFSTITLLVSIIFQSNTVVYANNLSIDNVTLEDRTPSSSKVVVEFDFSWNNSWKTKINHDAIWVTVRLHDPSVSPTNKKLCQLTANGLNPSGTDMGSNSNIDIYVPADKTGAFIQPSSYGINSSISSTDVQLSIDYSTCGFTSNDSVVASVFGLEMVYIPEGAFYAGDYDTSTAALDEGSSDIDPWYVSSESDLNVSNPSADGYRYVSNGHIGEDATGTSFTIPSSFPKGFGPFYVMKYEINEGQWVEFVNSLSSAARANRDLTDSNHKNTDIVQFRNTINCSGSPLVCTTSRPARALNYINWMDLSAFLDWAGLRPITELEYEKAARGPLLPESGEHAWATTNIAAATTISGSTEDGLETITNLNAQAHYNDTTLSGGDSSTGSDYQKGPLRNGIFAQSSATRESAGAGYYGVMELAGNLSERAVTIGNLEGRLFVGSHGDGNLTTASGNEGNATNTDWPGIDAITSFGVTGAAGSGFRGGSWLDVSSYLRISDRTDAAKSSTSAFNYAGGRGARSYDGN